MLRILVLVLAIAICTINAKSCSFVYDGWKFFKTPIKSMKSGDHRLASKTSAEALCLKSSQCKGVYP